MQVLSLIGDSVTMVVWSAGLVLCPVGKGRTFEVCKDNFGRFGAGALVVDMTDIMASVVSRFFKSNVVCLSLLFCGRRDGFMCRSWVWS